VVGVAGDLGLVCDLPGEADACQKPAQVLRVGGEVELDPRRDPRVAAGKLEAAARAGVRARRAARSRAACPLPLPPAGRRFRCSGRRRPCAPVGLPSMN
jgi:hypothetical protein